MAWTTTKASSWNVQHGGAETPAEWEPGNGRLKPFAVPSLAAANERGTSQISMRDEKHPGRRHGDFEVLPSIREDFDRAKQSSYISVKRSHDDSQGGHCQKRLRTEGPALVQTTNSPTKTELNDTEPFIMKAAAGVHKTHRRPITFILIDDSDDEGAGAEVQIQEASAGPSLSLQPMRHVRASYDEMAEQRSKSRLLRAETLAKKEQAAFVSTSVQAAGVRDGTLCEELVASSQTPHQHMQQRTHKSNSAGDAHFSNIPSNAAGPTMSVLDAKTKSLSFSAATTLTPVSPKLSGTISTNADNASAIHRSTLSLSGTRSKTDEGMSKEGLGRSAVTKANSCEVDRGLQVLIDSAKAEAASAAERQTTIRAQMDRLKQQEEKRNQELKAAQIRKLRLLEETKRTEEAERLQNEAGLRKQLDERAAETKRLRAVRDAERKKELALQASLSCIDEPTTQAKAPPKLISVGRIEATSGTRSPSRKTDTLLSDVSRPRSDLVLPQRHTDNFAHTLINHNDPDQKRNKDERIRKLQERNHRSQAAAVMEELVVDVPATVTVEPTPISLGGLAKQQSLRSMLDEARKQPPTRIRVPSPQRSLTKVSGSPTAKETKKHDRKLGEVLSQDLQVIDWRDKGMTWPELSNAFEKSTGLKRSPTSLRKRHAVVQAAIKQVNLDQRIIEKARMGYAECLKQLNKALSLQRPEGLEGTSNRTIQANSPSIDGIDRQAPAAGRTEANPFGVSQGDTATPRPTMGGKTIDAAFMDHVLGGVVQTWQEEEDGEDESDTEHEDDIHQDYCHYAYLVYRARIMPNDLDDETPNEDADWILCGQPHERLSNANAAAATEIYRIRAGDQDIYDSDSFVVYHDKDQFGMQSFTLDAHGVGAIKVAVTRDLRTYQDQIRPSSKEGWLPRVIFYIMKRTTFDTTAGQRSIVENIADTTIYTCPRLANSKAIGHFVHQTLPTKCQIPHLDWRKQVAQRMETKLLDELGEDDLFSGREGNIEVWVQDGQVQGPRNVLL